MTPLGLQTYKRTSIKTADGRKLVVMLYEGAIRNLHIAVEAMATGDEAARSHRVRKTLDIIQYLSSTLDFAKGGEIARNLLNLYDYIRDTITRADIAGDPAPLREVITLLNTILGGWKEIASAPAEGASAAQGDVEIRREAPRSPFMASMAAFDRGGQPALAMAGAMRGIVG